MKGGKEQFYGYKMHSVCDAHYGIPLGHTILPIIRMRNTDKDGIYTADGRPKCLGRQPTMAASVPEAASR